MPNESILVPVFLMVLLTIIVWVRMFIVRLSAMKSARLHPEKMKSQQAKTLLPESANVVSENFVNIFEVPTLFYALVGFLMITDQVSLSYVVGAYIYVFLRAIHSTVVMTYNRVMHRFSVYVLSCIVLWLMWANFAFQIFTAH